MMTDLTEKRVTARRKDLVSGGIFLVMLLLFAFYANLRWESQLPAFNKTRETADTPAYQRVSGEDLFSKKFWANARPPVFPLLLRAYPSDGEKVAAFQTIFSIAAWGLLALSLAYSFHLFLRPLAFGLVLALSLDRHIAGWDLALLTESLSLSLMALFLAAWLWLLRGWSWGKVALLILVAGFWAFTRDTNGWLLLMTAGLILLGVFLFKVRKRYLAVAFLFALIFALSNLSADKGYRWVFPFQNVLAQRILVSPNAIEFFENCGMPLSPELLGLAGGLANSGNRAFYVDPALESYRVWMYANGKTCYMRWLVSRPFASVQAPWPDFAWLLAFEDVDFFFPRAYEPVLPWYAERVLYPQDGLLWLWAGVTIAALAAIWFKVWRWNRAWIVFIVLSLLIYPHLFLVWHGDVMGTHRHALTVSLQFILSFWFLGLLLAERILAHLTSRLKISVAA